MTVIAAVVAALVPGPAAAVGGPCVAAGMLAVITTGAPAVPQPVGPALTAADRQSTTADSYTDTTAGTGLSIEHIAIGAAGCLDAAGTPGGTTTRVAAWNVLSDAVGGSSLQADLVPASGDGTGWKLRPNLSGLLVSGTTATVAPGTTLAIGNWGVLDRPGTIDAGAAAAPLRWWRAALELRFTRAHAGFATGTRFLIGWVSADRPPAAAPSPPPPTTTTTTTTTATETTPAPTHGNTVTTTTTTLTTATPKKKTGHRKAVTKKAAQRKAAAKKAARVKRDARRKRRQVNSILSGRPLAATPSLGAEKYDFPVLGTASWGDTYGAGRSDVAGGWHHGDDLFVALGTPVVAIADGTVFSVGWNAVGGWRLWLEDRDGNDFYYAHLSGYTKLAHNNNHVRRGQVLGFVGNTGDAFTTIPHLHFEVHPFGLLSLGYDGAVDPTTYLAGWQHPVSSTDVLPPVPLPSPNFRGSGSLTDFRRLLALRPLAKPPASPAGGGGGSSQSAPKTGAVASEPTAVSASGGWVPAAAGALLLALAVGAVVLTARQGRSG